MGRDRPAGFACAFVPVCSINLLPPSAEVIATAATLVERHQVTARTRLWSQVSGRWMMGLLITGVTALESTNRRDLRVQGHQHISPPLSLTAAAATRCASPASNNFAPTTWQRGDQSGTDREAAAPARSRSRGLAASGGATPKSMTVNTQSSQQPALHSNSMGRVGEDASIWPTTRGRIGARSRQEREPCVSAPSSQRQGRRPPGQVALCTLRRWDDGWREPRADA